MKDVDFAQRYGPWAVVAGGSEGIGSAMAERLAAQGLKLLLIARKPGPLESTAAGIRERYGTEVRTLSLDLTTPGALAAITEATSDCEVGLLIHNAGADSTFEPFIERPLEACERLVQLNVITPMRLVHHFAAAMAKRGKGGVILCSSMGSLAGFPGISVYSASKSFMNTLAESIWYELGTHNVDVLVALLPFVRTPAMERLGVKFDGGTEAQDPFDIADEVLASIRKGPALYAGGSDERAMRLRTLPRDEAVLMGAARTNAVSPTNEY